MYLFSNLQIKQKHKTSLKELSFSEEIYRIQMFFQLHEINSFWSVLYLCFYIQVLQTCKNDQYLQFWQDSELMVGSLYNVVYKNSQWNSAGSLLLSCWGGHGYQLTCSCRSCFHWRWWHFLQLYLLHLHFKHKRLLINLYLDVKRYTKVSAQLR